VHAVDAAGTQLATSVAPDPEQAPGAHWFALLTQAPLGHSESDVQRHSVSAALHVPTLHTCVVVDTEVTV
jgi:hypothetical protein